MQVFSIDQLVTYLRKLLPSDEKAAVQEDKKDVEVPQGGIGGQAQAQVYVWRTMSPRKALWSVLDPIKLLQL